MKYLAALVLTITASMGVNAQTLQGTDMGASCHNSDLLTGKLITDLCWDCIFPIVLSGVPIGGDMANQPDDSPNAPFCFCDDDLGVPLPGTGTSLWEPTKIIELTREPGCSQVLHTRFPMDRLNQGHHKIGGNTQQSTFQHAKMYNAPLLQMLNMFSNFSCGVDGYFDLDLAYLSELDPTWDSDELAFFMTPEASLVASNPLFTSSCAIDAAASTAAGADDDALFKPLREMWWCSGSWGIFTPLTGNNVGSDSNVTATSLMTAKLLYSLHRRGIMHRGNGADAMCEGVIDTTMDKQSYKFTLIHPIPETESSHWMGASEFRWGLGRTIPAVGEDLIYYVWRRNDCCLVYGNAN
ncbi:TraU family protein [uncultured Umboniibacter sp.]|uniref:TraU family protein n=1 Tax=uncultured Umboniibacter sp. TaxID=1798917 RepID=UPI002635A2E7|nr:TraU family protein [uncultured Umboniibacter sp.]